LHRHHVTDDCHFDSPCLVPRPCTGRSGVRCGATTRWSRHRAGSSSACSAPLAAPATGSTSGFGTRTSPARPSSGWPTARVHYLLSPPPSSGCPLTTATSSSLVVWSSNLSSSLSFSPSPGSNTSNVLWQSFEHPTDTHMSGAWVGENKLTGEYQVLTSWRNAQDPEPGIFIETVDPNGSSEFLFMWNRSRTYWQTGLWTGRFFANMPESARGNVLFNQTYVETPAYRRLTNILYNNETITRLVLDLSGQSWQLFWTAPTVQCDVYALCGVFGVCDQRSELPCRCPPSFTPAPEGGWTLTDRSVAAARARHSRARATGQ
uniref:non-specific serine/threonine protein kinase n=1 Tax=Aegilops tauschii subsp. strangulata TaxID=200361 RepID=A0A453SVQ8_AEGTS